MLRTCWPVLILAFVAGFSIVLECRAKTWQMLLTALPLRGSMYSRCVRKKRNFLP